MEMEQKELQDEAKDRNTGQELILGLCSVGSWRQKTGVFNCLHEDYLS